MFAFSGVSSMSSLQQFATGGVDFPNAAGGAYNSPTAWWSNDVNNNSVTSFASFQTAVATLRTPEGRSASYPWPNPVQWTALNVALSTPEYNNPLGGGALQTVQALQVLGIEPVVVFSLTCTQFNFSTIDASRSTYWGERYELYKIHYMSATWAFRQGVRKYEFWCEIARRTHGRASDACPWSVRIWQRRCIHSWQRCCIVGATAPTGCTRKARRSLNQSLLFLALCRQEPDANALCMNNVTWLETYTLSAQAIQNAYADGSADVASGALPGGCPVPAGFVSPSYSCPLSPLIFASAFYWEQMSGLRSGASASSPMPFTFLGAATVAAANTQFPPLNPALWNNAVSVQNMNVRSRLFRTGPFSHRAHACSFDAPCGVAATGSPVCLPSCFRVQSDWALKAIAPQHTLQQRPEKLALRARRAPCPPFPRRTPTTSTGRPASASPSPCPRSPPTSPPSARASRRSRWC